VGLLELLVCSMNIRDKNHGENHTVALATPLGCGYQGFKLAEWTNTRGNWSFAKGETIRPPPSIEASWIHPCQLISKPWFIMVYWNNLIRGSTPQAVIWFIYIYIIYMYIYIMFWNHGTPAMINSLMVSPRGRGFVSGRCGWDQGEGHPGQNGVWLFAEHESLEFDVARLKASENPGEDRKLRKENRNLINSVATMSLKYMMKGTTNNFMEICVKMSYSIDFNSWSTI
jgi:hypothetical protein